MKKADRQKVYEKYGGKCAYCGCDLGECWSVDHIEPVNRTTKTIAGFYRHKGTKERVESLPDKWWKDHEYVKPKTVFDKMLNPERDTVENSNPSCNSCNITKSAMSLEEFRVWIQESTQRLNSNNYASYKFGKRYGLIQETGIDVKFYFETI